LSSDPLALKAALAQLGGRLGAVDVAASAAPQGPSLETLLGVQKHPKQAAFVRDPSKRKAALAGRRGGKTEGAAVWLIEPWQRFPHETSIFVARTGGHARAIMWPVLQRFNRIHKLGLKFNENLLTATFPNGYCIRLYGADTRNDVEKFRGPRYARAVLDEAGSWPPELLEYVVDSILDPALMDLDGDLCIIGSPGVVPAGYFYDITEGPNAWSTHRFDCRDNPYVKGTEYLARKLRENGWTIDHPTFVREYLGQWVRDASALVCPYSAEINSFQGELPHGEYAWAISVDLGAGAMPTTSFAVGAARRDLPQIFLRHVAKHAHMTPSRIAVEVEKLRQLHVPDSEPCQVIIDEGGLGVGYAEELRTRYGLHCVAAEKRKRRAFQEVLAGDMKAGVVKLDPAECREFVDEVQVLKWSEDRKTNAPGQPDHAYDSVLYLVRALRITYRPEENEPLPGSPEALQREWKADKAEARERGRKKRAKDWRRKGWRAWFES
jgi:hypothetical protein